VHTCTHAHELQTHRAGSHTRGVENESMQETSERIDSHLGKILDSLDDLE
jgi:hypothetical protein